MSVLESLRDIHREAMEALARGRTHGNGENAPRKSCQPSYFLTLSPSSQSRSR